MVLDDYSLSGGADNGRDAIHAPRTRGDTEKEKIQNVYPYPVPDVSKPAVKSPGGNTKEHGDDEDAGAKAPDGAAGKEPLKSNGAENAAGSSAGKEVETKDAKEMSFCLRYDAERDAEGSKLAILDKPHLRTASSISIQHLKKYIIQKFSLSKDFGLLQFSCRGKILDDQAKVGDVFETIWIVKTDDEDLPNGDLELHYFTTAPRTDQ